MFEAFKKALAQLNDTTIQQTLLKCVASALLVFMLLWVSIGYLLNNTTFFDIGWLEIILDWLGGLATFVLTWFLFPGVVSVVIGLFLDKIARAVEARHYPHLGDAPGTPASEAILSAVKFLSILIALNLFMLIFLVFPPIFPFVFYSVNGYLLGREYFEMVAFRRMPAAEARILRKQRQGSVLFFGVLIAFMLTVPFVNLLTPIVATAAMVHLFQQWHPGTNSGTAVSNT